MPKDWYTPRSLFNFTWRASRREYFLIQILAIFVLCLPFVLMILFTSPGEGNPQMGLTEAVPMLLLAVLQLSVSVAVLVVMLAVAVRRMHDQEKSGWLLLLGLVPLIGWIFSLIFVFTPGDEEENRYGPNPRYEPRPGTLRADDLGRVFD